MTKKDFLIGFIISLLICISLIPTLLVTNLYNKIPFPPLLLIFISFPLLTLVGLLTSSLIAKKIKIVEQIAKFGLVGVSNTAVDFGVLNSLIFLTNTTSGSGIIPINATSFSIALVNSYFWNKRWVFGEGKRGNFVAFFVVTLIGLSINTSIVYLLTTYVTPIGVDSKTLWTNIAKVLATGVSLFWNFAGYKLIVFKK